MPTAKPWEADARVSDRFMVARKTTEPARRQVPVDEDVEMSTNVAEPPMVREKEAHHQQHDESHKCQPRSTQFKPGAEANTQGCIFHQGWCITAPRSSRHLGRGANGSTNGGGAQT